MAFRESVPARTSFAAQEHWRRPVPGFGDQDGSLLILGLAPSAVGGNRTGRIFTGDGTGVFLMKMLYLAGFASQPTSEHINDGLKLKKCYLTASVKCVPPKNLPTPQEFATCSQYLAEEFRLLKNLKVVLALGALATKSYTDFLKTDKVAFVHGKKYDFPGKPPLYCSYHPSPQNTNTGKLTEKMFLELLHEIKGGL